MEYLFGEMTINGEQRHTLRVKGTELDGFAQGSYHVHTDHYPDVTLTDSFRVDKLLRVEDDSEGNHYAWYSLSEYSRNIDRSPAAQMRADEAYTIADEGRTVNSIAFVTLAEAGSIDDVTAGEHADLFVEWSGEGVEYTVGQIRRYGDKLYRCIGAHKSQADWTPDVAVSLWTNIADPAEEWPEWSQPVGAHDAYQSGDKVTCDGKHWQSTLDNNVWRPGVAGWDEVD